MRKILSVLLISILTNPVFAFVVTSDRVVSQDQSAAKAPLKNIDVLEMLNAGLAPDIVVAKINGSRVDFDTSPSVLADLKKIGTPESVIMAMVQASNRGFGATAAASIADSKKAEVTVPDGTAVSVVTEEEISSKTASEGDALTFRIDEDVTVNGRVVIAKGSIAKGTVSEVAHSGHLGKGGKLGIKLDSTIAVDNQSIKLRASKGKQGDDKTGSVIALTLLVSPLFLLKKGKDAKLKSGTKLAAYTDEEKKVLTTGPGQ